MIRYSLICDQDHQFESWFQSAIAFDSLQTAGMITCASCGSGKVRKSLMAPNVQMTAKNAKPVLSGPPDTALPIAPKPDTTAQDVALAKLRNDVETNSDYVGLSFAAEARAMHDGTKPERAIYGEANGTEARKLIAEGIPVMPLPFIPRKKLN